MKPSTGTSHVFGAHLTTLRESAGLTRAQLAEAAGLSRQMLRYIEVGDQLPSLLTAWKIAVALETTVDHLCTPFTSAKFAD